MKDVLVILSLAVVCALCVVGVLHERYRDNLAERIGMALIGIWCAAHASAHMGSYVNGHMFACEPPDDSLLHAGLLMFALGVAWAKWCKPPANPNSTFTQEQP